MPVRRFRSPHTTFPHSQFLSNGNYVTSVTNAGGGASLWRGLSVTRWRRDVTRDADCVAILVAHSAVDYQRVVRLAPRVFDAVNATRGLVRNEHVERL